MERVDIEEFTSGYGDRVRRLALFAPLFELDMKRTQDQQNRIIDMKGLGLLTLLFFFENKLMRQYRTGVKELAQFLKYVTEGNYLLDDDNCEKIARMIIQTFRPSTGKKKRYDFFNWEHNEEDVIEYAIIKANNFDAKTNTQYYTLDEDGLELLFATKEFYSEFQLSINQLLLRKQLDKGEFKGALRQINEMRIDVESLEERMRKLKHDIQRSIISEETFNRYKDLLDDIYGRLSREDEEFQELRHFVKETRERLYSKDVHQKEQKTYELVVKINSELEKVHYEHSNLLEQTFAIKNTTLVTAQESLYYTGLQSFNFDQDLVSTIVSTPLPVEAVEGVVHPFLKVEENKLWSPLAVLADQNITEEQADKDRQGFMEVSDHQEDEPYRKWLTTKYKELMMRFLTAYQQGEASSLKAFMTHLENEGEKDLYKDRYFYDFWLILHQRSPVQTGISDDSEGKTLLGEALALLGHRVMHIKETSEILNKTGKYSIQDMMITVEED